MRSLTRLLLGLSTTWWWHRRSVARTRHAQCEMLRPKRPAPWQLIDYLVGLVIGLIGCAAAAPPAVWSKMSNHWLGAYDPPGNAWLAWAWGRQWSRTGPSTHIMSGLYPTGVDLRLIDSHCPHGVAAALSRPFGPYLGYNIALLTGVLISGCCGYLCCRCIVSERWPAAMAGLAWMMAPTVLGPVRVHLSFTWSAAIPLCVIVAVKSIQRVRIPAWIVASTFVFAFWCSAYTALFGAGAATVLLLASAIAGHPITRSAIRSFAFGVALAVITISPLLLSRLTYSAAEPPGGGASEPLRLQDSTALSIGLLEAALPADHQLASLPGGSVWSDGWSQTVKPSSVGWAVGLLAVAAGIGLARRNHTPPDVAFGRFVFAPLTAMCWILALGPTPHLLGRPISTAPDGQSILWLPWTIVNKGPLLSALRAPYRVGPLP